MSDGLNVARLPARWVNVRIAMTLGCGPPRGIHAPTVMVRRRQPPLTADTDTSERVLRVSVPVLRKWDGSGPGIGASPLRKMLQHFFRHIAGPTSRRFDDDFVQM